MTSDRPLLEPWMIWLKRGVSVARQKRGHELTGVDNTGVCSGSESGKGGDEKIFKKARDA